MCSHDKFTIWLSHCGSVKIRVCNNCHEPEWLSPNHSNDEGQQEPEWETMLDQTVSSGADLCSPPPGDEIPF